MKVIIKLYLLLLCIPSISAQNLVLNPSFEEINRVSSRWSGTYLIFNENIEHWSSPTQGSPDILHVSTLGKMTPPRKNVDLTQHQPRTGKVMVGVKTFGCQKSKLQCKEYIQVKLADTLVVGEKYYYEYWISPVQNSIRVNSFGVGLSTNKLLYVNEIGLIDLEPMAIQEEIIGGDTIQWYRITGVFEADAPYQYMILGNFGAINDIQSISPDGGLDYGYYLFDDVMLKPLSPAKVTILKTNEVIILEHIIFEFDKATIKISSEDQLNELEDYLQLHEKYQLEVFGHTDAKGSLDYNLQLSQKRAIAIKQYLVQKGIHPDRISAIGKGSSNPVVTNDSDQNRQLNRRVEIKINEG